MTTMETRSAQELAEDRTSMAATRTLLAVDRTLMAWVPHVALDEQLRLHYLQGARAFQEAGRELPRSETPRNVGLFLSALGTAAIVMGTLEYLGTVRTLRRFQAIRLGRPSLVMALLMSIGSVFLFFSSIIGLF